MAKLGMKFRAACLGLISGLKGPNKRANPLLLGHFKMLPSYAEDFLLQQDDF